MLRKSTSTDCVQLFFDSWIYSDAGRAGRRCIVRGYTVEMSFLTPIIMLLVMSSIYAFFYEALEKYSANKEYYQSIGIKYYENAYAEKLLENWKNS